VVRARARGLEEAHEAGDEQAEEDDPGQPREGFHSGEHTARFVEWVAPRQVAKGALWDAGREASERGYRIMGGKGELGLTLVIAAPTNHMKLRMDSAEISRLSGVARGWSIQREASTRFNL
jgi:hypothetical protein